MGDLRSETTEHGEHQGAIALNKLFYYGGYMLSRAIHVAACLGIADVLKDGPLSAQHLAVATHADPNALYRLLRVLASAGVFKEVEGKQFALTPLSTYLRSDTAGSLRAYIMLYGSDLLCRPADNLLYSVRTGLPAFNEVFGRSLFPHLNENADLRALFDAGMASVSSLDLPSCRVLPLRP